MRINSTFQVFPINYTIRIHSSCLLGVAIRLDIYDVTGCIAAVRIAFTTSPAKALSRVSGLLMFKLWGPSASFGSDSVGSDSIGSDSVGSDSVGSWVATFVAV